MEMTWLLEIKKRLEAATPGPWFNGKGEGEAGLSRIDNGTNEMFPFYPENHDAEFIANAPTDIAHLLEAIRVKNDALAKVIANENLISGFVVDALAFDPLSREKEKK